MSAGEAGGDVGVVDEFTLAEQRKRQRVARSRVGMTHVVREHNWLGTRTPGGWTRQAWDSQAMCGSMRFVVTGGDAVTWATNYEPIDISRVTCRRCADRYARWLAKTTPATPPEGASL